MTNQPRSFRQGLMLFTACALVATVPAMQAFAQTAAPSAAAPPPPADTTENIVVTGSKIKHSNATSENPVTIVTGEQIAKSSATTIEDVLSKLPAIGTAGIYGTTNNGGEGASCTDIRNLGIARTLVLVNGRRFVHSGIFGVDCVDLNNIPLNLIERIEILKDGASALYGADAVGGVINIILKKSYSGTKISAGGLVTGSGDGRTGDLGVTTGGNFDNDKGNIVVDLEYTNREPVKQIDRAWATPAYASSPNLLGTKYVVGSGIPLGGRVFTSNGTLLFTGPGVNDQRGYHRSTDGYNYGAEQYLQGSLEKESFTSITHYDFNPNITGFLETYFTHKKSQTQLAPQPVTGGLSANVPDAFIVPQGNPYAEARGIDETVSLFRRVGEFGDRVNEASTTTFQITGGFSGSLPAGWDYDTFFTYGRSDNTIVTKNNVNFQRLEQEMGYSYAADNVDGGVYDPTVCQAAQGCVLANIFGPTSLSPAAVNYARFTETATSTFQLRTFGGSVTNKDVFDLPYGPVGVALGVEHRREDGEYNPDALVASGVTLENSQQPTKGGFDVTEIFGETSISLLKDLPFIKSLTADLQGRYFDYNTFGNGETWKVQLNYTPITGVRFRANSGTSFRQPGVNELYGGQALSFITATDPCANASSYGGAAANVIARCASQIKNYNPNTFQQLGNGQVQTITGGNPALQPETARTQTAGVVLNPPYVGDMAITVDYWRTKIASSIGVIGTQDILDGCYSGSTSSFCDLQAPRDNLGQLRTVAGTNQNLGVTKTDGLDIGLTYTLPVAGAGSFTFSNELEVVFSYISQNIPNGPFINFNGQLDVGASIGYPRKRDNASVTWNKGPFELGYQMRYISGLDFYPGSSFDPKVNRSVSANEVFYHDISGSYTYKSLEISAGIQNLLDKDPPFVLNGTQNTDPNVYDILGRVFYLKTSYKF